MRYAASGLIFGFIVIILLIPQCAFAQGPVISAAYLQDKLERGQDIFLKSRTISDDLILRNMNLTRDENSRFIINSSLELIDCEIKDNLSFGLALFAKPVIFRDTRFSGTVNLARSRFADYCSFHNTEFQKGAIFEGANFTKDSDFINARFDSTANMKRVVFCRPSYFREAKFFEDLYFRKAIFQDAIDFEEAKFYKSGLFSQCRFNGTANFQAASFFDICEFDDAVSNGEMRFIKTVFSGEANFNNVSFRNGATFNRSKFLDIARFNNANFSGNASFFGSCFDKEARFYGAVFGSMLDLSEATFSQISLNWDSIKGHLIRDKKVNQSLINNYKILGWTNDRDQCYYDYRNDKRVSSEWGFSRLVDTVSFIYCGYGVRYERAIIIILSIIIIFGLIYKCLAFRSKSSISFKDALVLSARTLLLKSPDDIKIEGEYVRYAIWIQKALGIIAALFIVFLNEEIQSYFRPPF